jgi:hypothetical protein
MFFQRNSVNVLGYEGFQLNTDCLERLREERLGMAAASRWFVRFMEGTLQTEMGRKWSLLAI